MRYFGVDVARFILSKTKTVLPKQKSQVYLEGSTTSPLTQGIGFEDVQFITQSIVRKSWIKDF
jgi:hypothetical protein